MPKKTSEKVGFVRVHLEKDGRWRASWWDAPSKRYVRRVLPAADFAEAKEMAKDHNRIAAGLKGFLPTMRGGGGHTIQQAFDETIPNTDANGETKAGYARRANAFIAWLDETHRSGVEHWSDVTPKTLLDYVRDTEKTRLARDTIRQRLFILRKTSRFMADTYPDHYTDVAATIRQKRPKQAIEAVESDTVAQNLLNAEQLVGLLDYFQKARPDLYPVVCLVGLCGMRIREAAYVREQDVDFKERTVRIAPSAAHAPKNRYSNRTAPRLWAGRGGVARCDRCAQSANARRILVLPARKDEALVL